MSRIRYPISFVYGYFHENVKKSSIPKCYELSLRCHFYPIFSIEMSKKLDTQMSEIKHSMSILYMDFSMKMSNKLDTQMSQIKHPMSFLYRFFHQNVHKSSIPKCQELSIRCHFYIDFNFSMIMLKKARYPNVKN